MRCLSYRSRQPHVASTAMAANSGCIRNAAGYKDWRQILINAGELPILLAADRRVLPRWHAFCWQRLWTSITTYVKNIPPPLLQDPWPCVQHLRAERYASCQWNLVIDHNKHAKLAVQRQGHGQTDLLEDLDLILRIRRLFWFEHVGVF